MSGICISVNMRVDLDNLSHTHREALSEIIGKLRVGKTDCSISETDVEVVGESNLGKPPKERKKRKKLVPNKIQVEGSCANEPTLHIEEDKAPVIAMQYPNNFTEAEIESTEQLEVPNQTLPPCVEKAIQKNLKRNQKQTLSPFELAAQKAAKKKEVVTSVITMAQLTTEFKALVKKMNSVEGALEILNKFDANKLSEVKQESYYELHKLLVA